MACHWIRGKNHSELLWIVGDHARFNEDGAVPTNTTTRKILRMEDENNWHSAEDSKLLAGLAALFHDMGKANATFQKKLRSSVPLADPFRHEWVSLRLLEAFVGNQQDHEWLDRLVNHEASFEKDILDRLQKDDGCQGLASPFSRLPPLAKAIGWLIISHHRLPLNRGGNDPSPEALRRLPGGIKANWCGARLDFAGASQAEQKKMEKRLQECWKFPHPLPLASKAWKKRVERYARRILGRPSLLQASERCDDLFTLHMARMILMLADHHYSSLTKPGDRTVGDPDFALAANTIRGSSDINQLLDEHLIGVEMCAGRIANSLPRLERLLPRIARHKGFKSRSRDRRFAWQDKAYDLATALRGRTEEGGFFGVNMASTGCGKTLANGRIMYALADPGRGARFSVAMGLRVLTMQTGAVFRRQYHLGKDDLAVLVGGGVSRELYEHYQNKFDKALENCGSESLDTLLPEDSYVHYEGSLDQGPLNEWLANTRGAASLVNAPILVCTIDHLIMATESARGGRQIAPMLRLLTSDLVLDEPDDFGVEDLPALARLVHWAGLLGSRVLLSSATLPPSLIEGLFTAYLNGRESYQRNCGIPSHPLNVCVAWFDEFDAQTSDHDSPESFIVAHSNWTARRIQNLATKVEKRRVAKIVPVSSPSSDKKDLYDSFGKEYLAQSGVLHERNHNVDPKSSRRISFGLIRMANIRPLVAIVRALLAQDAPTGHRLHICCYHSQHPMLVRSSIERRLDTILDRNDPQRIFSHAPIRQILDSSEDSDHLFIVMATAVAEVGRDHDYDWAIVEPSSMRSIIQLAGRVRRHRSGECETPNLHLLNTNFRHHENAGSGPVFCKPGFESKEFLLTTHHLADLLSEEQLASIDSRPRIQQRPEPIWSPRNNLVDLEHDRLRSMMVSDTEGAQRAFPVKYWWETNAHLTGELQRVHPFRKDPLGRDTYIFLMDDDSREVSFVGIDENGDEFTASSMLHPTEIKYGRGMGVWGDGDYQEQVLELAEELDMSAHDCSRRFGRVELPKKGNEQGWDYHPALGLSKKDD